MVTKTLLWAGERGPLDTVDGQTVSWFRSYDKATGAIVSEMQIPANVTNIPMTYMSGGKQYIVDRRGRGRQAGRAAGAGASVTNSETWRFPWRAGSRARRFARRRRRLARRAIRDDERRMAIVCRRAGQHEILAARPDQQGQRQEPAHRVAVQDRQLRRASRLQHAGDAAHGQRRHVRAGRRAARCRGDRSRDRRAVVDVAHGRRQARRRGAAPGIGTRRRVLDRWQGRRTHSHRHARLSSRRAEREDRRARSDHSAATASSISRPSSTSPASI